MDSEDKGLYPFPVTPGDEAAADQFVTGANDAATKMLALYLAFCQATDEKNKIGMTLSHLAFTMRIRTLIKDNPEELFGIVSLMCHYLYVMLWERHGSWDEMAAAIEKGQLFIDGDEQQQAERETLSKLKEHLKE